MAREIFTARRKLNDGAVAAKYRPAAPKTGKTAAKAAADAPQKRNRKAACREEGDAAKKPAAARAQGRGAPGKEEKKQAEKKPSVKKIMPEASAAKKSAAGQAEKKPSARKRAAKDEYTAVRRRSAGPARESGRQKRDRKRMEADMRDRRRAVSRGVDMPVTVIALLTAVFTVLGLLLAAVRGHGAADAQAMQIAAVMTPLCLLTTLILPRFVPMDPLIMALTNFLCSVGVVILYTVSPDRGALQAQYFVLGIAAMLCLSLLVSRLRRFRALAWLAMITGVGALILPLAFGQWAGGAKNWVQLPFIGSFQPSELVKLSLVLALAYYFSAHRTVLQMMPALIFAAACLLLLMLQRDLGTALIYYATTLVLFYVACGNVPLTALGLCGGAGAAILGYRMFAHVKVRVAMWRNPWSDPLDKGYQIIQALLAIGSGGLFGVGLGQGTPDKIPAYYNDFIFAVICEQMGLVFGLLVLIIYLILILRGVSVISRSRRSFDMLLGCGVLASLGFQTFMIVAGVIKMIPLTGVTMPFLSYGGSSLLSCLCMIGIVHGIAGRAQADMEEDVISVKD